MYEYINRRKKNKAGGGPEEKNEKEALKVKLRILEKSHSSLSSVLQEKDGREEKKSIILFFLFSQTLNQHPHARENIVYRGEVRKPSTFTFDNEKEKKIYM